MTHSGLAFNLFHFNYYHSRSTTPLPSRRARKGLTRYEESTLPQCTPVARKFPPRSPAKKKRAKRRELPFCCVVKRTQCPTRINANIELTKERAREYRIKVGEIYGEGKHGRAVRIEGGKSLSYFHS